MMYARVISLEQIGPFGYVSTDLTDLEKDNRRPLALIVRLMSVVMS